MEFPEQSSDGQIERGLNRMEHEKVLEDKVKTPQWQELTPNFASPDALLPKELTADQIKKIAARIGRREMLDSPSEVRERIAPEHLYLEDGSTLDLVGRSESMIRYVLVTQEGKKMAVMLRGYQESLGVEVPTDPKLTKVSEDMKNELYSYDDFRTYLSYPVSETAAIVFQEYGDVTDKEKKHKRNYLTVGLPEAMARRKTQKYLQKHGFDPNEKITQDAIKQDRHVLYTKKGIVLTDIPAIRPHKR